MGCSPINHEITTNKIYDDKILSYYSFSNFELIAEGNYGPVYRCISKIDPSKSKSPQYMIMTQYIKERVLLSRSLYSIMNELVFYKKHNNQCAFITDIKYAFQDKSSFYIIQEYLEGGDIFYHMNRKIITETKAKFLIANLILGVEFLHKKGYVHRNLKPENLLLTKDGYWKINDMKLLRECSKTNYFDSSGASGYMAPEIWFRQNHGCCSDIFSIGVITYEMMFNKLPFKADTRKEYSDNWMSDKDFLIKESDLPEGWSRDCADFINRCIQKRAVIRIGYNGVEEWKEHRWFKEFKWIECSERKWVAPFIPKRGMYKLRLGKEQEFLNGNIKQFMEYYEISKKFEGYYYNYKEEGSYGKDVNTKDFGRGGEGGNDRHWDEGNEEEYQNMNEVLLEGWNWDPV